MRIRDGERLAQPPGSGAELPLVADAAAAAHGGEACGRHQGANQDGAGAVLGFADEIDAPMDAVRPVDIRMARRSEHHGIAPGRSCVAVRCGRRSLTLTAAPSTIFRWSNRCCFSDTC